MTRLDGIARCVWYARGTYLEYEEAAYPRGFQTRAGRAILPSGRSVPVRAGIADTFFSIPAHERTRTGRRGRSGVLSLDSSTAADHVLTFIPNPRRSSR